MEGLHRIFASYCTRFANDDYEWVHFIHDYYRRVFIKSRMTYLDPYRGHMLKFRFADFLQECNIPKEAAWIVLLVNQMDSDSNFENMQWIMVPDMADIAKLRDEFDTIRSHKSDIRENKV